MVKSDSPAVNGHNTPPTTKTPSVSSISTPSSNLLETCSKCDCVYFKNEKRNHLSNGVCDSIQEGNFPSDAPFFVRNCSYLVTECIESNIKNKEKDRIPEYLEDCVILMNSLTMGLLDIKSGDSVSIKSLNEDEEHFQIVWETESVKKMYVSSLNNSIPEGRVMIRKLSSNGDASLVIMQPTDEVSSTKQVLVIKAIQRKLRGKDIKLGMIISLESGEDIIRLQVIEIKGQKYSECDSLSQNMGNLDLTDGQCLKVTQSTILRLFSPSQTTLNDIVGLETQIKIVTDVLNVFCELKKKPKENRIIPTGIIIHGFQGTGKSLAAQAFVNEFGNEVNCFNINCYSIVSSSNEKIIKKLKSILELANSSKPCLLILDHIDSLFLTKKSSSSSVSDREIPALFSTWFESLNSQASNDILLIGITNNPEQLDSVRWPGMFEMEVEFPVPISSMRRKILQRLLTNMKQNHISQESVNTLGDSAYSYTGADLLTVVRSAVRKATLRSCHEVTEEDLIQSLVETKPSAMKEINVECKPILWSAIGGVKAIKREIDEVVIWPLKEPFSHFYDIMKLERSTGILLYGPPGCSKTMIGQAIATESKLNFISIRGPELFSKYVGDSEKSVRDLFSKARQAAPSMIFIDEIDALASARGTSTGNSGVGDRVVNTLLIEMDGIKALKDVVVVAATNRPQIIDPALKRPGRFDRQIYVPLPDLQARREIFEISLKSRPVCPSIDVDALASSTEGFSGAEIVGIVKRAALEAISSHIDNGSPLILTMDHFSKGLLTKPRTSPEMVQMFDEYYKSLNR